MPQRTDSKTTFSSGQAASGSSRPRTPIYRSVIVLTIGTIALFIFILVQGDVRRRQRATEQARSYAATLAKRVGDAGTLPLNLGPDQMILQIEWLSRQDAGHLRKSAERGIVAQTKPVLQVLAYDGQAVIFFQNGRFDVEWLALSKFDERHAAQRELIRRLAGDAGRHAPDDP